MLSAEERRRYLRHLLLREVGAQGQLRLRDSHVLVVGAGGLGTPVVQYLAAAGVGGLTIIDDDLVELSNLQRQVMYSTAEIGRQKCERAAAAAQRINPDIRVKLSPQRLDVDTGARFAAECDLVVEGVDNFDTRYMLNRVCIDVRRPLVSGAVGRFDAQISVFKPHAGPELPCYRCFMPEPPLPEDTIGCEDHGVLGPLPGVAGSLMAVEAIKELLGFGASLAGRMVIYNALTTTFRTTTLTRDHRCSDCGSIDRSRPEPHSVHRQFSD